MSLCSGLVGRKKNGARHRKTGAAFTNKKDVDESDVGEVPRTCWAELG